MKTSHLLLLMFGGFTLIFVLGILFYFKISSPRNGVGLNNDYLDCKSDYECIAVPNLMVCSGCSCGIAINKEKIGDYEIEFASYCKDYNGPVCDMNCSPTQPKCVNHKCVLIQ